MTCLVIWSVINEFVVYFLQARGPKGMGLLTPYVVVDTKALVQHLSIVKHFVSMRKFIVLIPSEGKEGEREREGERETEINFVFLI